MKKYEYVRVFVDRVIFAGTEEHRQRIDEYASKGYRYVGFIPTNISPQGRFKEMDLIFEKDE